MVNDKGEIRVGILDTKCVRKALRVKVFYQATKRDRREMWKQKKFIRVSGPKDSKVVGTDGEER